MNKIISIFTIATMFAFGVSNQLFAQQENYYETQSSSTYDSNALAQGGGASQSASSAGTGCGFWTTAGLVGAVAAVAAGIVITNGKTTNSEH